MLNEINKANCSNCEYVKYYENDEIRLERCSVFHHAEKFNGLPINVAAQESILNWENENPIDLCEKYQRAKELRVDVFY